MIRSAEVSACPRTLFPPTKLNPPFSFPPGNAGAGGFPHAAKTARLPPQEGFQTAPLNPPGASPVRLSCSASSSKGFLALKAIPQPRRQATDRKKLLHDMAAESLRMWFDHIKGKGGTRARSPEEFYGFRAEDVAEMRFRKRGFGRGF